jgi:hypothetical protein
MERAAEMDLVEDGMSPHGSRIRKIRQRQPRTARAMATDLAIVIVDGEKRIGTIKSTNGQVNAILIRMPIVAAIETKIGPVDAGSEMIEDRSVSQNGWTSRRTRRNVRTLQRTFKSGKRA